MKNILVVLLCVFSFTSLTKAQCTFEKIFPLKHGVTKFKSITALALLDYIVVDKKSNQQSSSYNPWYKPDYLNGDSVLRNNLHFTYFNNECFKSNENELNLYFVDDRLYKMDVTLTFSNDKFEDCIATYNNLVALFKNQFYDWSDIVSQNPETNEQTGEGYWLYPTSENERDNIKLNKLEINYRVIYERKWRELESYQTGNVDRYEINLSFVNLNGTKLTNQGY